MPKPTYEQRVRVLQVHLDELVEIMYRSQLARSDRNLATLFNRVLQIFYKEYAFVIRRCPDHRQWTIPLNGLDKVRNWERELLMQKPANKHLAFEGSDWLSKFLGDGVSYAASRVLWLEKQARNGLQIDYEMWEEITIQPRWRLQRDLSKERRWIVDRCVLPPLELQWLMSLIISMNREYREISALVKQVEKRHGRVPNIEEFAVRYTEEAMKSCRSECEICFFKFDHIFDNEKMTEPAVQVNCGHVFGEVCLSNWVGDRNNTCPMCRGSLFEPIYGSLPPGKMLDYYGESKENEGWFHQWRHHFFDQFLQREREQLYGPRMQKEIEHLSGMLSHAFHMEKMLNKALYDSYDETFQGYQEEVLDSFSVDEFGPGARVSDGLRDLFDSEEPGEWSSGLQELFLEV